MKKLVLAVFLFFMMASSMMADVCVDCHQKETPGIVNDWKLSKHYQNDVSCSTCHGDQHKSAKDVNLVNIPTPETCANCHEEKVEQFKKGKHALAWAAMNAMPTIHMQPMALIKDGAGFGVASCDACHTRHTFSKKEAQQPQACQTCHMGFDHPQWEMYSASKHGVRNSLKQMKLLPENASAPTCQTCHMQKGDHEVRTAWGFLAVRLPLPKDEQWKNDQVTILKALGVLDPQGNPTALLDVVKKADVARLDQASFDKERNKMIQACSQCHSENFAKNELAKGDSVIKKADRLMAEAIEIVAGLYKDGIIKKPANYPAAYPMLLTFHDAPTVIEQKLFVMFLKHRMRTFQGTFHHNPDYSLWYGWSEMVRDLAEIKEMAKEMRASHTRK